MTAFSRSTLCTAALILAVTAAYAKTDNLESRAKTLVINFMAQKFDKVESQFDSEYALRMV